MLTTGEAPVPRYNAGMRLLLRISRAIITIISFVLAICIILLWIRSQSSQDIIARIDRNRTTLTCTFADFYTDQGRCEFSIARRTFDTQEGFDSSDGFLIPAPN